MSTVKKLIGQVRDGLVHVDDAAPEIARLVAAATARNAAEVEGLSRVEVIHMRMAGVLDEADDTDTFVEVEAARFLGALTEDQYDAIRAAVLGGAR